MFQCISNTVSEDHWGGKLFAADFLPTIPIQWNNQNKFNYLHWPVYEGPDDWHSSEAMKSCLTPLINGTVGLNDLDKNKVPALFYLALCEHQEVLADVTSNHATCVHRRILSDDVLRCHGIYNWIWMHNWKYQLDIKDDGYHHPPSRVLQMLSLNVFTIRATGNKSVVLKLIR